MALVDTNTFESSSNLNLWLKVYTGGVLYLSDVPEIISLRWTYFRDNWHLLHQRLINNANSAFDPDYLRAAIADLTEFIDQQRNDTTDVNPFTASAIYYRFYPVFDNIRLEGITLTNDERTIIANKKTTISSYSKLNFLNIKKVLRNYRDNLADSIGLSDPTYDSIYGRSSTPLSFPVPSISDLSLMKVIEKQIQVVDFILSNLFAIDSAIDPFALAKQNANNPDIDIRQYSSGKLVKLNYKEDLPGLAKRYLGSADRWIDIAIANGLKEPYVDETGEQLFLLTNGNGNQINLSMRDAAGNENISKFYVNQSILIQSNTNPFPSQRVIQAIKQIPISGEILLTVDGSANMSDYLLTDGANIRVFKPNTVNSSQYILIPSPKPLSNPRTEEIPWFLASKGADEKNTKIDIALGDNGQILQTPSGDIALSYGIDNAIQAIQAKLQTELGSNRRHAKFGLINVVGTSSSRNTDVKAQLIQSIVSQIQVDKRFDRVQSISVDRDLTSNGVAYLVELVVKLSGSETFVPITFTVNS
jgi:hypothetical protein